MRNIVAKGNLARRLSGFAPLDRFLLLVPGQHQSAMGRSGVGPSVTQRLEAGLLAGDRGRGV